MTATDVATRVSACIRDIPDFPKPGILFKDICPLLADAETFAEAVAAIAAPYEGRVDKVVGIEARGFIVAAPVAHQLRAGFVPVRKIGKLPGATHAETYALEYGEATLEVQQDAFTAGDRVLIVDDVLATGGTAAAAARLIRRAGAEVVGLSVLIELGFLDGRTRLDGFDAHAIVAY